MTTTPAAATPTSPPFITWGRTYAPSPRAARLARKDVADTLVHWDLDRTAVRDLTQIAAELAGNAVRHGRVPGRHFLVRITRGGGRLQVEVADAAPALPVLTRAPDDSEGGRGLRIVDALSDAWGVTPRDGGIGKTVWAVIAYGIAPGGAVEAP